MSDTITLTDSVLRALGEGVSHLNDGDESDGLLADEVIEVMRKLGYRLGGYEFYKQARFSVTVNGYTDTCETKNEVVSILSALPMAKRKRVKVWDYDDHCWRDDLTSS